mgnify:CR=1 FL=1
MTIVSVPFRGISFLNNICRDNIIFGNVSVPFRGISFLNITTFRSFNKVFFGFRPLPGYLISQL